MLSQENIVPAVDQVPCTSTVKKHSSLRLQGKYFSHYCSLTDNKITEAFERYWVRGFPNNHMLLKNQQKVHHSELHVYK